LKPGSVLVALKDICLKKEEGKNGGWWISLLFFWRQQTKGKLHEGYSPSNVSIIKPKRIILLFTLY
jgi:hypothetical protein